MDIGPETSKVEIKMSPSTTTARDSLGSRAVEKNEPEDLRASLMYIQGDSGSSLPLICNTLRQMDEKMCSTNSRGSYLTGADSITDSTGRSFSLVVDVLPQNDA